MALSISFPTKPCHSARSASLARIFTQTLRPALMMLLSLPPGWGSKGACPLASPCRGSRVAWPQRVGWLCFSEYTCAKVSFGGVMLYNDIR